MNYNGWKLLKQDFIGNIGIELLELEDEVEEPKRFIGITKYEKKNNVVFPIEDLDEIMTHLKILIKDE